MKKFNLLICLIASFTLISLSSCTKEEGPGGKATISGTVTYPDGPASGAIVWIAYGTNESTMSYDHSTVADANGNYELEGLETGDYFIDAELTLYQGEFKVEFNTAGYAVTIGEKKADIKLDIELE